MFFFFKQKTAYEMRISDWSSDVCSSDLLVITADAAGNGIAINEMDSAVAVVGGETRGLSHYFGLNDVFTANTDNSDYNSFSTAQQRDSTTALGIAGTLTFTGSFGTGNAAYATNDRSDEHTSELQSLMRISYADFCSQ